MSIKSRIHQVRILSYIIEYIRNWPSFLYHHFIRGKSMMIVNLKNGYRVLLRPDRADATMLMETWGCRDYTPKGFAIKRNDVVFDIGGHIGSFSLYAASKAVDGRVFSFEPLPENHKIFARNIELNKLDRIMLERKAISDKKGTMDLYLYDGDHSGSSSLFYRNTDKKITIETTTLQDVFRKNKIDRVNFMKIDCEGAEYDILFNLPKNLLMKIDKISMEYHDSINQHHHSELLKFFRENGFRARLKGEMIYAINPKFF